MDSDLTALYAAYADALDEDRLEAWPALFVEDASYRVVSRENWERGLPLATMSCESRAAMEDRVRALRETQMYSPRWLRHIVGPLQVTSRNGEGVEVEANYAVFESAVDMETRVLSVGRYRDRVVRDGEGALRFKEKVCVYDSALVPTSLVYPL